MQKSIRSISRQGGFIQWDFQKRIVWNSLLTVKNHRPTACINRLGTVPQNAEQKGHQLKEYRYYDGDTLCTVILADFTAEQICIENKVDEILDTAFGVNETPSWEDFLAFLADRCIPKTRKGLDYYLDAVGVPEYDPVLLVEKTQGRMAEDHKWLEII